MARPAFVEAERDSVVRRSRIGEVVFGVQDGITSTIGIVSSMVGGHQSNAVALFVGSASAIAGMFSMAVGSYLSSKAELDVARIELRRERRRIERERDNEVRELAAIYRSHGMPDAMARSAAETVARDPERLLEVMAAEEFGVDARPADDPRKDALAMALSFLVGAIVPVAPYGFFQQHVAFELSIAIGSCCLFAVGAIKAHVVGLRVWRSGLQTFAFGALASVIGYFAGTLLPRAFGIQPM